MPHLAQLLLLASFIATTATAADPRNGTLPADVSDAGKAALSADPDPAPKIALDDGPYLRRMPNGIEARWICDGAVVRRVIPSSTQPVLVQPACGYDKAIRVDPKPAADASVLPVGITRLVALSDVHGQYDLMTRLLQANGIIDGNRDWAWGNGHLVMTGDLFDRGEHVTEAFWLLYGLEQQARAAGGGLHFLVGNHEAMVLQGDLRYVHEKYLASVALLGQSYPELHGEDSVLGQWLRSKPVLLQAGEVLFVHGGIHDTYLALGLSLEQANDLYRASLGRSRAETKQDPVLSVLYDGKLGPLWYRGYFVAPTLDKAQVDAIASRLGVSHIVVGHTSMEAVESHFDGTVLAIDSSIKEGQSGELLFIEDGVMSRGTLTGERIALP